MNRPDYPRTEPGAPRRRSLLIAIGAANALILVIRGNAQLFDTNFYSLWEATALLAGDHPYRDFFEWGVPLQAAVSALGQWIVGYRLAGELLLHWAAIIAGSVVSFHIGLRLSRAPAANIATALLATAILAATPTFHYPKLLFYPLAIWIAWAYLDRPSPARMVALSAITAVAFLFRHDHGVYIAALAAAAIAIAATRRSASNRLHSLATTAAGYAGSVLVLLTPWVILVHLNEGFPAYVAARAELYQAWSPSRLPYVSLQAIDPGALATVLDGRLPSHDASLSWLVQVVLLIPIALFLAATRDAIRYRGTDRLPPDTWHVLLAAGFLVLIESRLFREATYFVVVAPITAAVAARLIVPRTEVHSPGWLSRLRIAAAATVWLLTAIATVAFTAGTDIYAPRILIDGMPSLVEQLLAAPPIDAYQPRAATLDYEPSAWHAGTLDEGKVMTRYLHDCTRAGDRVLISGSTPFHIPYYVERPIAGGHLFWHHRWRSDPAHELESLRLLQRQSVPFAYSTHNPLLEDLSRYPRIRAYLMQHYVELPGSGGRLLIDRRRNPTGSFGKLGFPCFR